MPPRITDRPGAAQREWGRHRAWPSAWLHGREADHDDSQRDEAPAGPLRHGHHVHRRWHGRRRNFRAAVTTATKVTAKGGLWLLEPTAADDVFTPERLTDEHRLMAQTTDEFIEKEVLPNIARLEAKDWAFARTLVRRAGELGLLGVNVPEEYG